MRTVALTFGAVSLLIATTVAASAMAPSARPLGADPVGVRATEVAFGCGPGFFPNRFGVCRPRLFGPRFYGRPYGYHRFGYGYGYRYFGYRRF